MSKGYVVAVRHRLIDPAAMAAYGEKAGPSFPKDARPLVLYGRYEVKEGSPADGVAILEFPSFDDAKAWYDSPEYAAAREVRLPAADYHFIITEGL